MSNVIAFPKTKKDSPPQSMQELMDSVEETRKAHVEYVIDEALSYVFSRIYEEGFDLGLDHCIRTTGLVVEALRAAMYNTVGIRHPLHEVAEGMFVIEDGEAVPIDAPADDVVFADDVADPDPKD